MSLGGARSILAGAVSWFLRIWVSTLRVTVLADARSLAGPRVLAFLHAQQVALLAIGRPRETSVLVSWSRDGELQAGVLRALGLLVVRGSSTRGGAAGVRGLVRRLRAGGDVGLAVDGPRGPAGRAKPGALVAARAGRAPVVPVASACAHALRVRARWETFELPWPFARVAVVVGAPLEPGVSPAELEAALAVARARAEGALGGSRRLAAAREVAS